MIKPASKRTISELELRVAKKSINIFYNKWKIINSHIKKQFRIRLYGSFKYLDLIRIPTIYTYLYICVICAFLIRTCFCLSLSFSPYIPFYSRFPVFTDIASCTYIQISRTHNAYICMHACMYITYKTTVDSVLLSLLLLAHRVLST